MSRSIKKASLSRRSRGTRRALGNKRSPAPSGVKLIELSKTEPKADSK